MNPEILEMLRKKSQPKSWEKLNNRFKADILDYIDGEPVYKFHSFLTDSLEVNAHSISVTVQPCSSYIPYHQHNYAEMMIPLLGSCCTIDANGRRIALDQEDIMIMGKDETHSVEELDAGVIVVNIALRNTAFPANDLNFMLDAGMNQSVSGLLFSLLSGDRDFGAKYCVFKTGHDRKIIRLIYDVIDEYYNGDVHSNQIIHFDLLGIFARLIRHAYKEADSFEGGGRGEDGRNILKMLLYIEKNYADITLNGMAKKFGFNPNYLSSYLKKRTGLTFIQLVHLQRINVAAGYLADTSVSVDQIAAKVGYENPSYFYKVFKKNMRCLPNEYRKRMHDSQS